MNQNAVPFHASFRRWASIGWSITFTPGLPLQFIDQPNQHLFVIHLSAPIRKGRNRCHRELPVRHHHHHHTARLPRWSAGQQHFICRPAVNHLFSETRRSRYRFHHQPMSSIQPGCCIVSTSHGINTLRLSRQLTGHKQPTLVTTTKGQTASCDVESMMAVAARR